MTASAQGSIPAHAEGTTISVNPAITTATAGGTAKRRLPGSENLRSLTQHPLLTANIRPLAVPPFIFDTNLEIECDLTTTIPSAAIFRRRMKKPPHPWRRWRRLNGREGRRSEPLTAVRGLECGACTRLFSLRPHPRGGVNNNGAGRSSGFRIVRSVAPSPHAASNDGTREWRCCGRSSPITAAGPRWTCTIFPLIRPTRGGPAPRTIHLSIRGNDSELRVARPSIRAGLSSVRCRARPQHMRIARANSIRRNCWCRKVRDAPSPVGAPRQAFRRQPAIAVDRGN